jgi:hypothetical protein
MFWAAIGISSLTFNPVRANMVEHPAEYSWSSYRINAQGESSTLLTQQPRYEALGSEVRNSRRKSPPRSGGG